MSDTSETVNRLLAAMDETQQVPDGKLPERTLPPVSQSDAEIQAEQKPVVEPVVAQPDAPPVEKPKTWKVKAGDEELEVDEQELVRGYTRMQDYTRKTMSAAETRKAAEVEIREAKQVRDQMAAKLTVLDEALTSLTTDPTDWAKLRAENPTEFAVKWAEHGQREEARNRVNAERAVILQQQQQDLARERAAQVQQEQDRLVETIPEFRDPVVRQREVTQLTQYGVSQGFQPHELANVVDHRAVVILRKAMLYDQLQEKKKALPNATGNTPTLTPASVAPPASPQSKKDYQAARAQLKDSGKPKDAVAAILAALNTP